MRSTRLALQRWSCSSAFMLWSSVITPSTRPSYSRGTNENIFNFNHSSKPMTIERASGVLVRRWGIVWSKLEFTVREHQGPLCTGSFPQYMHVAARPWRGRWCCSPDDSGRQPATFRTLSTCFATRPTCASDRRQE